MSISRNGQVELSALPSLDDDHAIVRVEGLVRRFGDRVVLKGLDFSIAEREVVALIGASGSGKSTALRVLAGLDSEAEGRVVVPTKRAVVFQDHRLLPWKKVWKNVVLGVDDKNRDLAKMALTEVGLEERLDAWPGTLSGGEAQRVALARAFVRQPSLLLLDEPFGALDALTRLRMQGLFATLCAHHPTTVLIVTHDVDEALILSDRVLTLENGEISNAITVDLPRPRVRSDERLVPMRQQLLASLGVENANETGH